GNPGSQYTHTRHNIGFLAVDELARRWQVTMKPVAEVHGDLGCVMINGRRVHLLKPTTFMNLSGKSVQAALSLLDITNLERLLVIIDDIYLPVGGLRARPKGSPGGHNGLKDVERKLVTPDYPRLRVGVGTVPE
ncbi:hypothetical protein GUITHDRAFT_56364, partial [Guillardia theta CCMP2712]